MYVCRKKLNLPFMKIGDIFSRDHSTVMTSVKQIQKSLDENNLDVASTISTILTKIQNIVD